MARALLCAAVALAFVHASQGRAGDDWQPTIKSKPTLWTRHVDVDRMTDKENATWVAPAEATIPDSIGRRVHPRLLLQCRNGETRLIVQWGRFITTGDAFVKHRIGKLPMRDGFWPMSTNFEASFHSSPIDLLKAMRGQPHLLVETIPYGSSAVRAEFFLDGIDEVVDDIAQRCEWAKRERPPRKVQWECVSRNRFGSCNGYRPGR